MSYTVTGKKNGTNTFQFQEIIGVENKQLVFRCIQDEDTCEQIWKFFNPFPENIYRDWNYIKIFHDAYQYTPHFYTAFENGIPVACIAMEWVPERGRLEMFGNRSYIHYLFSQNGYEKYIEILLQQITLPIESESIVCNNTNHISSLKEVDVNYILHLANVASGYDYAEKYYSGNGKKNVLQKMRKLQTMDIAVEKGSENDLSWFFEMNKLNFGENSGYHDIRRQKNIISLHESSHIPTHILKFKIRNEIVAVRFLIQDPYKKVLYAINGGTNKQVNHLGKFIILEYINLALSLGCEYVDLGSTSFGYKQDWANTTHPVYNFKK